MNKAKEKKEVKKPSEKLEELLKAFLTSNGNYSFTSRVVLNTQFKTVDESGKHKAYLFLHGHKIAELCDGEILKLYPCYHATKGKISNLTFKHLSLLNNLARASGLSCSSLRRSNGLLTRVNGTHSFTCEPAGPHLSYFVV